MIFFYVGKKIALLVFWVAMCVGKNQMCYLHGRSFGLVSWIMIFLACANHRINATLWRLVPLYSNCKNTFFVTINQCVS